MDWSSRQNNILYFCFQKAENKNRKKLKHLGKSNIFKIASKYFVLGWSRPTFGGDPRQHYKLNKTGDCHLHGTSRDID